MTDKQIKDIREIIQKLVAIEQTLHPIEARKITEAILCLEDELYLKE